MTTRTETTRTDADGEAGLPGTASRGSALVETALPEPVRDHLGQQLRAVYAAPAPGSGPQFLGDEATVPDAFQPQIRRLETRLKTHEEGTDAVEHALDKILDAFGVAPATGDAPAKRP